MTNPPEITIEKESARQYTPSEAAERLGIKGAMLRRYASAYEETFGRLPRDERDARMFSVDVVQRFLTVRDLLRQKDVPSLREGFQRLRDGETGESLPVALSDQEMRMQLVLTQIEGFSGTLTQHLASLEQETQQLREQVEELRRELKESRPRRNMFDRLFRR